MVLQCKSQVFPRHCQFNFIKENCVKSIVLILSFLFSSVVFSKKPTPFLPMTFSAKFEQHNLSKKRRRKRRSTPRPSKGTIEYKYPAHVKLVISSPNALTYIANDSKTWYYTPPFKKGESGTLTIGSSRKVGLSKAFDSLKKGLASNSLYDVASKKLDYSLSFKKSSYDEYGLKEIVLSFNNGPSFKNLKEMTFYYLDRRIVKVILSDIIENIHLSKKRFNFIPPKNTVITHQ